MIVTVGHGWAQREQDQSRKSGRVMSSGLRPNEKHWHGAAPTMAMTHIAIQEALDGKSSTAGKS
jgi:quercetin dioxygenase-like cupin family protein